MRSTNTTTSPITLAIGGVGAPLGQSIIRAALASERPYRLMALDIDPDSRHIFPDLAFHLTPHFRDEHYASSMKSLLREEKVQLWILGSEAEMLHLAPQRKIFEQETGCRVAISEEAALRIGTDKLLTTELLQRANLPFPRTLDLSESEQRVLEFSKEIGFPCIVKGRRAGLPVVVSDIEALRYQHQHYVGGVLQEFLGNEQSQEYTVGVFHTPEFGIAGTYCMERSLKYGLTWRGRYAPNAKVEAAAATAVRALGATGSVNVQFREHCGQPVIHEFNVRCSSTTVFRALSGWNEIDMAVDYFVHGQQPTVPEKIAPGTAVRFFEERWVKEERNDDE